MTDKDYIEYAKTIHEEVYAMSTPMIDGMAGKVLTRIRKEQKTLMPLKPEWTSNISNTVDVVDVISLKAINGKGWGDIHPELEAIIDQYIIDRFHELEPKLHFMLKYRYIGESKLVEEVKERIYARLGAHYATQRMQNMLERYPDLKEV